MSGVHASLSTERGVDGGDPAPPGGLEGPSVAFPPERGSAPWPQRLQLRQSSGAESHGTPAAQRCGESGREGNLCFFQSKSDVAVVMPRVASRSNWVWWRLSVLSGWVTKEQGEDSEMSSLDVTRPKPTLNWTDHARTTYCSYSLTVTMWETTIGNI